MRWCTYVSPADSAERVGLLHEGAIHGLPGERRLVDLLGDDGERMAEAAGRAVNDPAEVVAEDGVRFLAPVPDPPSIRDFYAFEEHVKTSARALGREVSPVWYEIPLFYFTNPAATRGPCDDIPVAPGSARFDYELEIAAVVGLRGSDLDPAVAERHIAGYMVMCDWSARDLQAQEMAGRLGPAKGKDGATSFSAFLVTPDELEDRRAGNAYDLEMTASVNGRPYSGGRSRPSTGDSASCSRTRPGARPCAAATSSAAAPSGPGASWSCPRCTGTTPTRGCSPATRCGWRWIASASSAARSGPLCR